MKMLNSPITTAVIFLWLFVPLCIYCYYKTPPVHYVHTKPIAWKTHKAVVIASIWSITPEETARPVELFR